MRVPIVLGILLATATVAAAQPAPGTVRVRGIITSVSSASMVLETNTGAQTMALSPRTKVFGETRSSLAAIAPGSYIGTTVAQQQDGSLKSVEVHIFAQQMKGTGEGYRPMASSNTMMANATVAKVEAPNMMANATVKSVGSAAGSKTIVLVYKGGSKTVKVGPDVPVVSYSPGTRVLLKPGAHASVMASKNGGVLTAIRIMIGENGLIPR